MFQVSGANRVHNVWYQPTLLLPTLGFSVARFLRYTMISRMFRYHPQPTGSPLTHSVYRDLCDAIDRTLGIRIESPISMLRTAINAVNNWRGYILTRSNRPFSQHLGLELNGVGRFCAPCVGTEIPQKIFQNRC